MRQGRLRIKERSISIADIGLRRRIENKTAVLSNANLWRPSPNIPSYSGHCDAGWLTPDRNDRTLGRTCVVALRIRPKRLTLSACLRQVDGICRACAIVEVGLAIGCSYTAESLSAHEQIARKASSLIGLDMGVRRIGRDADDLERPARPVPAVPSRICVRHGPRYGLLI